MIYDQVVCNKYCSVCVRITSNINLIHPVRSQYNIQLSKFIDKIVVGSLILQIYFEVLLYVKIMYHVTYSINQLKNKRNKNTFYLYNILHQTITISRHLNTLLCTSMLADRLDTELSLVMTPCFGLGVPHVVVEVEELVVDVDVSQTAHKVLVVHLEVP